MPIFDAPIHTNSQGLERVIHAGAAVILVIERRECAPCRQLDPILTRLAGANAGALLVARIDADEAPEVLRRFQIEALPGLVFLRNAAVVGVGAGAVTEQVMQRWADHLLGKGPRPPAPAGPSISLRPAPPPAAGPTPAPSDADKPITLTDATFDRVIDGDLPVLVDFWAPWCGPCHMIAPAVESLAAEFAGKLVVGKLNVDENPRTAQRFQVMSIPTLMIFRRGRRLDQVTGALPHHLLRQRVLPHVQ